MLQGQLLHPLTAEGHRQLDPRVPLAHVQPGHRQGLRAGQGVCWAKDGPTTLAQSVAPRLSGPLQSEPAGEGGEDQLGAVDARAFGIGIDLQARQLSLQLTAQLPQGLATLLLAHGLEAGFKVAAHLRCRQGIPVTQEGGQIAAKLAAAMALSFHHQQTKAWVDPQLRQLLADGG